MLIKYSIFIITAVNYVFNQESKSFTGCEMLLQFSLNNGTVIGNLDYHINRNPTTKEMFADIRGFTTTIPANFDFQIKHLNGEEWHCLNNTAQYQFMSCTHPLIPSDTFNVSLKTSTFIPNIFEVNKIIIDSNGMISWIGHNFADNCIYHQLKCINECAHICGATDDKLFQRMKEEKKRIG